MYQITNILGKQINKFQPKIILVAAFSFALLCLFCRFAWSINKETERTASMVNHTNEVLKSLERIFSGITELESGTRGFLLTKNRDYKDSIRQDAMVVRKSIEQTQRLLSESPSQKENIRALNALITKKILYHFDIIDGKKPVNTDPEQIEAQLNGEQLTDRIKAVFRAMTEEQNKLLIKHAAENSLATRQSLFITIWGGGLSFMFALFLLLHINKDIRLRKVAEAKSTSTEAKYLDLIQNTGVVMYTADMNGNFTFINNKCEELTGYDKKELLGKSFSIFIGEGWFNTVANQYINQVRNDIIETISEFPILTKDKKSKWIEQIAVMQKVDGRPIGFQCLVKDISERKQMQVDLEASEFKLREYQYRLEAILENTASLIFMKDLQGRYLMANKRYKEVFNLTEEQLIGKTDFEVSDPVDAERYNVTDQEVMTTCTPVEVEETIHLPDGPHNLLLVKFPLLDNEGRIFGISGIATDITERSRYQTELIEAKKVAENAEKTQELFLANMSHEIRTPMNGIQGMINLLSDTNLDTDQKEFVTIIKRSSDNLLVIINDVLDFSKIKAGMLTIEQIEFNLPEIIDSTGSIFKLGLSTKGLDLKVSVDPEIPRMLIGDPYRLSQVLTNLLGNAIKFTEKGEIRISISLVSHQAGKVLLEFKMADTGMGIAKDQLSGIFESFTQAGKHISRKFGGTGLGLAISKQLIKLMGGDIAVTSELDAGTTFSFQLPYTYIQHSQHSTMESTFKEKSSSGELKGIRVLVVEDNKINQKVVFYHLQKVGMVTDVTNNGKEAVQKLIEGNTYDLIIMDLQMPEMDGYETTTYIRNVLKLQIPIMAMTATVLKGEKDKCFEVGMNDYLAKPFDAKDLFRKIVTLLNAQPVIHQPEESFSMENQTLYNLSTLRELEDDGYLLEILDIFLSNTPQLLNSMNQAADKQDWTEVHKKAHTLKSSLGMLQINDLHELVANIEAITKENVPEIQVKEMVTKALERYGVVHAALEKERDAIRLQAGEATP